MAIFKHWKIAMAGIKKPFGYPPLPFSHRHGCRFLGRAHHLLRAGAGAGAVEDQGGAFTPQDASPPSASQRSWRIRHGSWLADLFTPIGSCFLSLLFFCCFDSIIVLDV